ncbi:ABC transporter substrate-binding protein [Roseinatronobacter alkalisoli]
MTPPARRFRTPALCLIALLPCSAGNASDILFTQGEGPFTWDSYTAFSEAHDYSGQTLRIAGSSTGEDKTKLDNMIAYFNAATGANVALSGSDSFEQDIVIGFQANSAPDIAMFPQPGLARDMAAAGNLQALPDETADWYRETFAAGESWADLATFTGPDGEAAVYGIFFGTDVKSLVWYVPENFEENGYDIPQSMEELRDLTQQIADDGLTPWCIGLGSGAATGWPGTDWIEDFMLRLHPVEVYDNWVSNDMPFDDPRVIEAFAEFGWFVLNNAFVDGGPSGVASVDFRDSPDGLFSFPPDCLMHKQASFIPSFFPAGVQVGEDVDFFYFPAYESRDLGKPIMGSGGLVSATNNRDVTLGFLEFLKTPFAHEVAIAQEQFLTAHMGANPDAYASATQRALGEILISATTFRFDGSDLMPGEIGTSAFWTGMVDFVTGTPAETVTSTIEARWNQIR